MLVEFEDDPAHPVLPPEDGGSSYQRYIRLKESVLSVLGKAQPALVCNENGRMLCLINWLGSDPNWHGQLSDLLRELNQNLLEELRFCFQCIISRMCMGISALPKGLEEIEAARSYRKVMGGLPGELVFYDGILRTTGLKKDTHDQEERQRTQEFYGALLRGDFRRAKELFRETIKDNFVTSRPAVQFVQLRMFSVIDTFLKSLIQGAQELGVEEEFAALKAPIRLMEVKDVMALEKIGLAILTEFQQILGDGEEFSRLPYLIRGYIREHYSEAELNVNRVADVFHVTPTYATRVFKKRFGMGISAFLQQHRIQEAKELLAAGCSVKNTAERTGYGSAATFIRAFKRMEGRTPAQREVDH